MRQRLVAIGDSIMYGYYVVIVATFLGALGATMAQNLKLALFLFPWSGSMGLIFGGARIIEIRQMKRANRTLGRVPRQIVPLGNDGDELHVAVTRFNGEHLVVSVPVDYDPHDDNGVRLMRLICPELVDE